MEREREGKIKRWIQQSKRRKRNKKRRRRNDDSESGVAIEEAGIELNKQITMVNKADLLNELYLKKNIELLDSTRESHWS